MLNVKAKTQATGHEAAVSFVLRDRYSRTAHCDDQKKVSCYDIRHTSAEQRGATDSLRSPLTAGRYVAWGHKRRRAIWVLNNHE